MKSEEQELPAAYVGFVDYFNGQRFFEAHELLEALWREQRNGPQGAFYKGLIQLAGAFVHLQKGRVNPARSLFELARASLTGYPARHNRLDLVQVRALIEEWLTTLEQIDAAKTSLGPDVFPKLVLS